MKAVVLVAGKGTRMLPLTIDKPKVLVEVNGKPFLWYVFDLLHQVGVTKIALIVGYKKEKIIEFLKRYNFTATIIEQPEQRGTGHAVSLAKKFVGKNNFLVYYGDGLVSAKDLSPVLREDKYTYMPGCKVKDWQKYGIMVEENGFLKEKIEKPSTFVGDLAWVGFFKTTPDLFTKLATIHPSPRGELEVTDAVNLLAQQKKVKVFRLTEYWLDLGTPEDVPKIEKFLKKLSL